MEKKLFHPFIKDYTCDTLKCTSTCLNSYFAVFLLSSGGRSTEVFYSSINIGSNVCRLYISH